MGTEVTLIANEGVHVATAKAGFYVDAFFGDLPGLRSRPGPAEVAKADLILVTHSHWDHFDAQLVAEAARLTGATVIGPHSVVHKLQGDLPPSALCEMEPAAAPGREPARSVTREFPSATVTAYRTFHSPDHNSYLVETLGFRFFHDGDNEDTRRLDAAKFGRLDALLIGPWQGGGWVEFIEKLAPARSILIHLDADELRQHDAGKFLPEICDHVPPGLVVLKPGETFTFS
jgi:L-ascorbate metabolism protein UlaG (beta-lactamase superfamily)